MRPPKIRSDVLFEPFQYTINDIFPTPLLRGEMKLDHEQVVEDCVSLIEEIKQFEDDPKRYYTTYFFEKQREAMTQFPWYTSFANQVKDTYVAYQKYQFGREVKHLTRHNIHLFSWVSVWEENIYHSYHSHQDSQISGTYYPINDSHQGIKFLSPAYHSSWISTKRPDEGDGGFPNTVGIGQPGSLTEMIFHPVDGETLMWPSNMLHCVQPQKGDYKRVAISFNLKHNDPIDNTGDGEDLSYEFL